MMLTNRQEIILKTVIEEHCRSQHPVGSKTIVNLEVVNLSSSTIRYELVRLEELGLLFTPHTSAGRIPTDKGYRRYLNWLAADRVDNSLDKDQLKLSINDGHTHIEDILQSVACSLTEATGLLSVITSPRAANAAIRHVEVLQLQPTVIAIVVITAAGDVYKHVANTDISLDPGLVNWVGTYLNDQVVGLSLDHRLLKDRLKGEGLSDVECSILDLLTPAFLEFNAERASDIHIGGSADLIASFDKSIQSVVNLVALIDDRKRLLSALRSIGEYGTIYTSKISNTRVLVGAENSISELEQLSVVGSSYGVDTKTLGMVGVIGSRSMNYRQAIYLVNLAAKQLEKMLPKRFSVEWWR